jgi:glycosyltransferase involved in cell wall biosynthesis
MRERRTRVLHVIQNLNYGGMERLLADIVRQVDPERFESHILVFQYLGRFSEGLEGIATLHQAPPMSRWSMVRPSAIARLMRSIAPDVVHSHSGVWYKASLAARMAGVARVIHTEHGRKHPDPWLARLIDGMASSRTDIVVAVSDAVGEQLRRGVVRGRCRVQVILNGVDTSLHRPMPDDGRVRSELGIEAAAPIIGSIGRLEPIKGYDIMVEGFARLLRDWRGPDAPVLVIAGDGSERDRLVAASHGAGIASQVRLLGWRDDVHALLAAFDLFTMSSRSEGTSVSLLEAMSSGLCPVVTDVGGNAAVLGPALRGRLVRPLDPDALARAWDDALRSPSRRAADAHAARSRVIDHYSLQHMVESYEAAYVE